VVPPTREVCSADPIGRFFHCHLSNRTGSECHIDHLELRVFRRCLCIRQEAIPNLDWFQPSLISLSMLLFIVSRDASGVLRSDQFLELTVTTTRGAQIATLSSGVPGVETLPIILALEECQQVLIDNICMGRTQTVRSPGYDFQLRIPDNLHRKPPRIVNWHDLICITLDHE
jgi:hypothetical protein